MNDDLVRLLHAGTHPDRVRTLVEAHGVTAALRVVASSRRSHERTKTAIAVTADERRRTLHQMGHRLLAPQDPEFLERLALLPDAPLGLFINGAMPSIPLVAIVGARACTTYGRDLAFEYGRAIAASGWGLVSGMARGIDGAAHRGVVAADGVAVAVFGSGLDVVYPSEHRDLCQAIVETGAVVSEYPPGSPPEAWRFPPRNRIISGLSRAVVVVEASIKGGALITARYAIEQDRMIFAVPGDIRRVTSEGCNRLIRDGAHPVLDPADLVEELSLVLGPPPGRVPAAAEEGC